jgi:C4-dicarboxylate-specific signal transduction histidine kinase
VDAALGAVLEGRKMRASCEYMARSGGEERWFEMTVEPFNRPEGGAIVTHIDITRRRRAEDNARREREALAHVLRVTTLGEMAASMAHEVSQPLAAIVTNAEAARLVLVKQAVRDEDVDGALTDIAEDARRAAHVIRRLRALFRKEWADQRKPVNVNEIIIEVSALLQVELEPKQVALELRLDRPVAAVYGDAIQLQQVMLNVIMNAAEAMTDTAAEHATITITTAQRDQRTVDIAIRDRGPGVVEHDLGRIFEPFVTTKKSGLGMGLSISRSIIEAHGGRIWATRNDDRGLTVHIELSCEHREDQP